MHRRLARWAAAGLLAGLTALSGCAQLGVVGGPTPSPTPYDGPLFLTSDQIRTATDRATGAAGRVVSCRTRISGDVDDPSVLHQGAPAASPNKALRVAEGEGKFNGVQSGFRLDRQDADRALFTYRVDGQVKQAIIVHHGPTLDRGGKVGWYVESWARCDLAEFDRELTGMGGSVIQIWRDETGRTVPTYEVSSVRGPGHCDWSSMTFLSLPGDVVFVRAPLTEYAEDYFADAYRTDIPLPADAVDTGYHRGKEHLWLAKDRRWAYVGRPESVEAWPREVKPLLCA